MSGALSSGRKRFSTRLRIIVATVAVGSWAALASASTGAHAASAPAPLSYTFAGDSITASPDSWFYALRADKAAGGLVAKPAFAKNGYTSAQVVPHVKRTDADVVVIEVGTNDVRKNIRTSSWFPNLDAIATQSGASHVLVMALPPSDIVKEPSNRVNRRVVGALVNQKLIALAASRNWLYVDPFASVRNPATNGWMPRTTVDGVHPTAAASRTAGTRMAVYIEQADVGSGH